MLNYEINNFSHIGVQLHTDFLITEFFNLFVDKQNV